MGPGTAQIILILPVSCHAAFLNLWVLGRSSSSWTPTLFLKSKSTRINIPSFLISICVQVFCMHVSLYSLHALERRLEGCVGSPGTGELQMTLSCYLGVGNRTWDLWKSNYCFWLLNRLSSPIMFHLNLFSPYIACPWFMMVWFMICWLNGDTHQYISSWL